MRRTTRTIDTTLYYCSSSCVRLSDGGFDALTLGLLESRSIRYQVVGAIFTRESTGHLMSCTKAPMRECRHDPIRKRRLSFAGAVVRQNNERRPYRRGGFSGVHVVVCKAGYDMYYCCSIGYSFQSVLDPQTIVPISNSGMGSLIIFARYCRVFKRQI